MWIDNIAAEKSVRLNEYYSVSSLRLNRCVWFPALFWIVLWFGVNTGPWVMRRWPSGVLEYLHYIRTVLPFFVLAISCVIVTHRNARIIAVLGPLSLWVIYGLVSVISGWISSPRPMDSSYWAVLYLAAFVANGLFVQGEDRLSKAVHLNCLAWAVTAVFLLGLVFVARDSLFIDTRWGLSGYGVVQRVGSVGGVAMSRSSGMARFAAVPALAAFVLVFGAKGFKRVLWAILFLASSTLVYLMQSRGALLGLGFAVGFIMIFLSKRTLILGTIFVLVFGLLMKTEAIPEKRIEFEKERFYRGTSEREFRTLAGRTIVWKLAWQKVKQAPIMGYGAQSDRWLLKAHVHNTYLYALLQSGFVGAAAFVGGLVWAWVLFFRAILRRTADKLGQRPFLIQAGGILAFFTVRSIPEVCGAMFGVDFLIMLPILGYLTILDQYGGAPALRNNGMME